MKLGDARVRRLVKFFYVSQKGLATQHMVEGDLRLAALSELGQGFHAEREMIGFDMKVETVLVAEPLVKSEMSRQVTVFVESERANASFGQRLRDQLKQRPPQVVSSTWQSRSLGDQHHFFI